MTRTELIQKADHYRKESVKATKDERDALLWKAHDLYVQAGLSGMAAWCLRWMD